MMDVIIIGAGPIGLACGIAAKEKGLSYLIVEKGALVNSIYHYPLNMTFFSTSGRLEIGGVPFISQNPKPTRSEALEYYRRVSHHHQLQLNLYETVDAIINKENDFMIQTTKAQYTAEKFGGSYWVLRCSLPSEHSGGESSKSTSLLHRTTPLFQYGHRDCGCSKFCCGCCIRDL